MMHNILSLLSLLALAGCGQAPAGAAAQPRPVKPLVVGTPAAPVVVELFQSQGCSSCPPANANVNAIADAPGVLALSFAVTYWDRLGWKDTFGSPAWTARQWDYARAAGRPQVATPQVIINGGPTIVGSNRAQLEATIQRAGPAHGGPAISARNGTLTFAAGKGAPSTIWLVRYDPRTVEVPIRAGENGGRTLPHRNIVRELVKLGNWSGAVTELPLPSAPRGLRSAVLVQQGTGGPITAARKL
ncbi:DUF1223 domain-containing protein [Sphingobium naphthae]|jgi:hypothetical protein|uniref:DUF1223 domain-containing protein n=1 Tax=Sphingobium naphthae TaxID=1886786 RepID=A0ABU4A1P2_9SPHN|nr:DUF1223 domain-containing protein [Sphingobium naphthae]MDV5825703.1 DUF1223 domain-containing protein [Sphingobium naphthae]